MQTTIADSTFNSEIDQLRLTDPDIDSINSVNDNKPTDDGQVNQASQPEIDQRDSPVDHSEVVKTKTMNALENKLELFSRHNESAHLYLDAQITETQKVIDEILDMLNQIYDSNSSRDSTLAQKLHQDHNHDFELPESRKDSETELSPPFRLVAIDQWNFQLNVIIESDGQLSALRPMELVLGWRLEQVDLPTMSATFEHQQNKRQFTMNIE